MKEITKGKIKFYLIAVAVFLIIFFLFICFYQIKQYDRHPHFNGVEGIIAVRHIVKNDLDYLQMKDNLYLCKDGKGLKLLTNEFSSFKSRSEVTELDYSGDSSVFKDTIVVMKSGKTMRTYAGELYVPEGRFYFVVLKDFAEVIHE